MNAIEIQSLKKTYDTGVEALKGIDLSIPQGSFFGLLGPNGAGKTTTIGILTGLVNKTSGSAKILNYDIIDDYKNARRSIGLSPQEINLDVFFTIKKILEFQAGYFGVPSKIAVKKVDEVLKKLGIYDKKDNTARHLSGGMKRRVQIAKALVHDPPILILDEPTAGVDIELRHMLWDYLTLLNKEGKTILLTTHYIEEAEMLCDKVAIIDKGNVIKEGTPKSLTSQSGKSGITINISDTEADFSACLSDFIFTQEDGRLHFTTQDPEEVLPKIINALTKTGCHIQRVETTKSSLEDVFLSLTGKGINE